MDPQLQEMQKQIAALVTSVAVLRATCATKDDINEVKREVEKVNTRLDGVNLRFDTELPHLARKVEIEAVRSDTRSWMIGVVLIVLSTMVTLQFATYRMLDDSLSLKIVAALRALPAPPARN